MKNKVVFNLVFSSLFICLLAVSAYIRIPIGTISITFQTLFIFLIGMMLESKWGTVTVFCYLIIGLLGIPVFSNGGGLFYIFQPSFGYLIGFLFATLVMGLLLKKEQTFKNMILSGFVGLFIIYIIGLIYLYLISIYYYDFTIDGIKFIVYYLLIPLPIDIISIFISAIISKRVKIIFN